MKVIVTDHIEDNLDWEVGRLAGDGIELVPFQNKHARPAELIEMSLDADCLVVNMAQITREVIESWANVRLVVRHGIGFDNIDLEALSERGIPLVNIPDYCVEEVAEQAIALIMSLGRKIAFSRANFDRAVAQNAWDYDGLQPVYRMAGQTLGLLGCGRIGSRVLQKLRSFGFHFLVCDPYIEPSRKQILNIETFSVEHVLKNSDFVTLHMPLNEDTRHIINAQTLELMKPGSYLVNTARAGLIDEHALAAALHSGHLAGAGIDVFTPEPAHADNPLLGLDNVILTPHLSWYSVNAEWAIRNSIVDILRRFHSGKPLDNIVNAGLLAERTIEAGPQPKSRIS